MVCKCESEILSAMAWAKPHHTKGAIDRAGDILIGVDAVPWFNAAAWLERETAIGIVNNWRSVHSYPLHMMKMALKRRARRIWPQAIIAQRLKRLTSIELKLRLGRDRGQHPTLSQMQDIGGCRAVLSDVAQVRELEAVFAEASKKSPHRGPEYSKTYDYIANPKTNGYRSVHLVYRFRSDSPEHACYNGQRVEIQMRSMVQHYWATAVETYSTFAGEALKSNIGSDEWKRFFAVVSSAIAIGENSPVVPNTPATIEELRTEIIHLYKQLNVHNVLAGYTAAFNFTKINSDEDMKNAVAFLLVLNSDKFAVTVHPYNKDALVAADAEYARIEREQPELQAVLVSADSIQALRAAYPNYFLDTGGFITAVRRIIGEVA